VGQLARDVPLIAASGQLGI